MNLSDLYACNTYEEYKALEKREIKINQLLGVQDTYIRINDDRENPEISNLGIIEIQTGSYPDVMFMVRKDWDKSFKSLNLEMPKVCSGIIFNERITEQSNIKLHRENGIFIVGAIGLAFPKITLDIAEYIKFSDFKEVNIYWCMGYGMVTFDIVSDGPCIVRVSDYRHIKIDKKTEYVAVKGDRNGEVALSKYETEYIIKYNYSKNNYINTSGPISVRLKRVYKDFFVVSIDIIFEGVVELNVPFNGDSRGTGMAIFKRLCSI